MADLEKGAPLPGDAPAHLSNTTTTESSPASATDSIAPPPTASTSTPSRAQRFRKEIRRITMHFTPSWFSVTMGTGITSILLHQLPYQFNGLGIISNVIFGFNVLLFLLFLGISIARYIIWPQLFWIMLFHPAQSLFLGTFSMGMCTLISMCAISAAPAWGPGFATFTWVLWWINAVLSLAICIGLPFIQFTRHVQSFDKITGVWFLPVVTTIVCAATGGLVADILPPAHARLTLIVCWVLWGTGFGMAFLLMSLYYARQAIYKIPPAQLIVSTFLPLGPCGQGAFGLLQLSSVLYKISLSEHTALPSPNATDAETARIMATAIYAVSVPVALVIWGLGLVWLVLAVSSLVDLWLVSELSFNLGFWATTFPLGVFATAAIKFSVVLDSGAFRVIGTVLALAEVILWIGVASMTMKKAVRGEIFFSPCLAEMCDESGEPPKYVPPARKYTYQPRPAFDEGEDGDEHSRSRSRHDGSLSRAKMWLGRSRSRGRPAQRTN
ncbi:sulfite transporter Ssu1 [Moesziomyces antarcticus]|uniref:Sulfite transporter Ssu1 n=2 Tax=Pseudozyma antarctica TaxID=84753 RepID=A0A081CKX8_PSEA2|nr:sulfite transporter Ssu1 [Moesziomyces antarcticus]GAK67324.1 sulfite transporter Ssu1 [Moesziomyces antarcticus]SPO48064.1 related to Malic acid transport protein [Moesziomyces antarcticus]